MILLPQSPKRSLNKAYLKQRPLRSDIDLFKVNLLKLLSKVDEIEREENQKNHIRDFLRDTFFKDHYEVNTKDTKDLVVHLSKSNKAKVAVIIEAKRPTNKAEMITKDNPNAKGLHELILYYFDERNRADNNELKHLIISNVYEWFIFDANFFDKLFYRNTKIKRLYDTYINDKKDTPFFYEEIRKIIPEIDSDLPCAYFDIRDYENILNNKDTDDDKDLIALFKVLSAVNILKLPFADDSNKLDEKFYKELLHIIGLEEVKEKNKLIIRRKIKDAHPGSLIENTINILETEDVIRKVQDISSFGGTKDERLFNIAFELVITWINRILFLKLLEAQLVNYHRGDKEYRFLNTQTVEDYDELFKLFHQVLARTPENRTESIRKKYGKVPYLNSSLFEISELEDKTIKINSLDDSEKLELINNTVLKEERKKTSSMPALEYLFRFLDAYDFASEGAEDIQEDSKTLINASVLGKVFEKINGYKDGSIFTPGFITMYMCRESIRLAVLQKFKEVYNWNAEKFEDLNNYFSTDRSSVKIKEHNNVINSLRICDPAVGSGHFLVSSLNEIIAIKSELGILADERGVIIRDYDIVIVNDELIVTDYDGDIFEYTLTPSVNGDEYVVNKEAQRLQKTLFHEKQAIIENCLFGVDINPNSVKICRLRLWIELLKNAYYRDTAISKEDNNFALEKSSGTSHEERSEGSTITSSQKKVPNIGNMMPTGKIRSLVSSDLETLPNIDINIKCGNSLISRFPLDSDMGTALKKTGYTIEQYRDFVSVYRNEKSRDKKRELQNIIDSIKTDFRTEILNNDPKLLKLNKLKAELDILLNQEELFEESVKQKKTKKDKKEKLEKEINKLASEIDEIKTNAIYRNAFEWRFEFPEVLSEEGEFEGFDVVIGNPPYISIQDLKRSDPEFPNYVKGEYVTTKSGNYDIYIPFLELTASLIDLMGIGIFILPSKFFTTDYGKGIRGFLIDRSLLFSLVDFEHNQVFENATTYTCIISMMRVHSECVRYLKCIPEHILETQKSFQSFDYEYLKDKTWLFEDRNNQELMDKLISHSLKLISLPCDISRGSSTGNDKVFILQKSKDVFINGYGEAVNIESQILIKPIFATDYTRYQFKGNDKFYLLFPYSYQDGSYSLMNEDFLSRDFPLAYEYLVNNKVRLEERKQFTRWFSFSAARNLKIHSHSDILIPLLANQGLFAFTPKDDRYTLMAGGGFSITIKTNVVDKRYLLALLNSKLMFYILYRMSNKFRGGYITCTKQYVENLPIRFSEELQGELVSLVEKRLSINCTPLEISKIEHSIDQLVYKIYELSYQEIELIEKELI